MLDENLLSTLEQSLRQMRNAQGRLLKRLESVRKEVDESLREAESLVKDIEVLEQSATQTENAIFNLLKSMRSGESGGE